MTSISIIINCHREHLLAHPSLVSADQARLYAEQHGIACETLIVLDRPDDRTRYYLDHHPLRARWTVHEADHGDLGLARNHGIARAQGDFIAFLDGDDLWGENWLERAYAAAAALTASGDPRRVVWHPASSLVFGNNDNHYFNHRDMDDPQFDLDWLRLDNYWTSLSFGDRQIYAEWPYQPVDIDAGIGFEDWNWNCHVIAGGVIHKVVPDTLHFVRRKATGSMLCETKARFALPDWGPLFDNRRARPEAGGT